MVSMKLALSTVVSFAVLAQSTTLSSHERSAHARRAHNLIKRADLIQALFPLGEGANSWSTAEGAKNVLDLSDSTLGAFNIMKGVTHGSYNFQVSKVHG